jgi:hypothetical protein
MLPNFGCAQETCHTGPSWLLHAVRLVVMGRTVGGGRGRMYPRSVSIRRWLSRSTSKILMVLSEEQVYVDDRLSALRKWE